MSSSSSIGSSHVTTPPVTTPPAGPPAPKTKNSADAGSTAPVQPAKAPSTGKAVYISA